MGQDWELTEKEREILRLLKLGKTYKQICKERQASPNEISIAKKKESGEYHPPPKGEELANGKNPKQPEQDYSKMYSLFLKGRLPRQVAIDMNLPGDFVNGQYQSFLDMNGWQLVTELLKKGGLENFRAIANFISFLKANGYPLSKAGSLVKYTEEVAKEETDLQELRREHDFIFNQNISLKNENTRTEEENANLKEENQRLRKERENELTEAKKTKEWIDANPGITTTQIVEKKIAEALSSNYTMMDCTFPAVIQAMRAYPDNAHFLINPDPRAVHPIVHQYQNGFQRYCDGVWKQMKDLAYQYCTQNFAGKIRNDMAML